jgi:hypothetical protein
MAEGSIADITQRLVMARVGWCEYYNGTLGDEPVAGGTYNDSGAGSEWNNFRVIRGRVYGDVYPRLVEKRVLGSALDSGDDVAIAFFATNPETGGQYLVGWHRHAGLNDPAGYRERPGGHEGLFLWACASADATLLPVARRSLQIPKGKGATGQAQVTYARSADGKLKSTPWLKSVRKFMLAYDGTSLTGASNKDVTATLAAQEAEDALRGQGIVTNAQLRKVIETYAMRRVKAVLKKKYGIDPVDTSATESYDFFCSTKRDAVKVEVKGTRSAGESLLFSAAEVALARTEVVDLYVVSGVRISGSAKTGYQASGGDVEHVPDWGRTAYDAAPLAFQITRR